MAERHTVEKAKRTDDLIQRWPGYPDRHQVYLEGADILETIGGSIKIPAQFRYRGKVGSFRRRRQIADRHILDHAAAKRADLSHRKTSCLKGWASKTLDALRQGATLATLSSIAALAASFNPVAPINPINLPKECWSRSTKFRFIAMAWFGQALSMRRSMARWTKAAKSAV